MRNARAHQPGLINELVANQPRSVWNSHFGARVEVAGSGVASGASRVIESETRNISSEISVTTSLTRPPLREFLLLRLKSSGDVGTKAAALRAAFQREFHTQIHEKTVGMTLYRLLKNEEVYRRGHFWFYGADPKQPPKIAEVPE
jgi:hypothetical protein